MDEGLLNLTIESTVEPCLTGRLFAENTFGLMAVLFCRILQWTTHPATVLDPRNWKTLRATPVPPTTVWPRPTGPLPAPPTGVPEITRQSKRSPRSRREVGPALCCSRHGEATPCTGAGNLGEIAFQEWGIYNNVITAWWCVFIKVTGNVDVVWSPACRVIQNDHQTT